VPELFVLDWRDTKYGKMPTAGELWRWAAEQGYTLSDTPKAYRNGSVHLLIEGNYSGLHTKWVDFEPPVLTIEDKLSGHIKALLTEREALLAIPAGKRTPTERALLATMALLMYGYGVEDAG
jgi:hypothetical protein